MSETNMNQLVPMSSTYGFDELEELKAQKTELEQKINELHSENRAEALKTVIKLCKQFDFNAVAIGLAPRASGNGKMPWFSLGTKKNSFVVSRSK